MGVVFFLTTEGHIDVSTFYCSSAQRNKAISISDTLQKPVFDRLQSGFSTCWFSSLFFNWVKTSMNSRYPSTMLFIFPSYIFLSKLRFNRAPRILESRAPYFYGFMKRKSFDAYVKPKPGSDRELVIASLVESRLAIIFCTNSRRFTSPLLSLNFWRTPPWLPPHSIISFSRYLDAVFCSTQFSRNQENLFSSDDIQGNSG